jgi:hypothetical protein
MSAGYSATVPVLGVPGTRPVLNYSYIHDTSTWYQVLEYYSTEYHTPVHCNGDWLSSSLTTFTISYLINILRISLITHHLSLYHSSPITHQLISSQLKSISKTITHTHVTMTRSFSQRWLIIVIFSVVHIPSCVSFVLKSSRLHPNRPSIPRKRFQNPLYFETEDDNELVDHSFAESSSPPPAEINTDRLPIIPVLLGVVAFTAFWPLLAFLRFENPVGYFDIDTFLALQGILGINDAGNMIQDPGAVTEIIELPGMSPAEQVVAAFFGPPPLSTR